MKLSANLEGRVRFLVVDDEASIRKICATIGNSLGFLSAQAESAEAALAQLETFAPDVVLADLRLAEMGGIEFLERVKEIHPHAEVAIMTGYGSIESAVSAMRLGAYDYITKPFRVEEMKLILQRMAEKVRLVEENHYLRDRVSAEMELSGIVGNSPKIQDVLRVISRLKDTRTPVLITGESGTGKELVARAIHFRGSFAKRPFIAVDCGALVPTLIESELFGYERGAFTGANKAKDGLFQAASGGTIFLDEIGELPLEMQTKLLRVLQEREVRRVGSNNASKVDVRVMAATNRDLEEAYQAGTFRKDLYFRLNVVTLQLPSLRERRSDIPALAQHFLEEAVPEGNPQLTETAVRALLAYDWPGNVRELQNCIERAIALGSRDLVDIYDLPPAIRGQFEGESRPSNASRPCVTDRRGAERGRAQAYSAAAGAEVSRIRETIEKRWPTESTVSKSGYTVEDFLPQPMHAASEEHREEARSAESFDDLPVAPSGDRSGSRANPRLNPIPFKPAPFSDATAISDLDQIERQTIERVFQEVGGDKALAQQRLGISRATLYRKLKRFNLL